MKKSLIAVGAASVALAAMPVLGVFAIETDTVTDTINVTVSPSCTFTTESGASDQNETYSFTGTNGNNATAAGGYEHTFNVFCNDLGGYTVSATAHDLASSTAGNTDKFQYKATIAGNLETGEWHAAFSGSGLTFVDLPNSATTGEHAGEATETILTKNTPTAAAGDTWTATYSVHVGSATKADTYSGTIEYTLASAS